MYYCIKCAKPLCRFCLNEEIDSYYCRSCFTVYQQSEAATFKNKCSKSIDCPLCFNVMQIVYLVRGSTKTKHFHYSCLHCQFNTIPLGIISEETHELLMKILLYKGKYAKVPQQMVYDRIIELYRFNQEEAINYEKFCVRTKRKFVPYTVPGKVRKQIKFLMSDFERMEEDKRLMQEEERHTVRSFE